MGFSHSAKSIVEMHKWVLRPEASGRPLVFVVGAFAHGKARAPGGRGRGAGVEGAAQAVCSSTRTSHQRAYLLPSSQIDETPVDEYISISQFPLSAAYALGRITNALEQKWGIV